MLSKDVPDLSTMLEELTDEIRRFNNNLENLNLDSGTIQEAIEIARDIRTMIAGALGYKVKESVLQPSRPSDREETVNRSAAVHRPSAKGETCS